MSKKTASKIHRLTLLSDSIAETFGRINFTNGASNIITGAGYDHYVCGKCGSVLLKNFRKEDMIGNYAPLCVNCNTYNDSNKVANYLNAPVMLKDIPSKVNNRIVLNLHALAIDPKIPFCNERVKLSHLLDNEWASTHFEMPGVLYQYTSFFGLIGMIENHSIWITDVAYMNDTSEMKYGIELVNKYLDEKSKLVSTECKELLKRSAITASAFSSDSGYLIACFCEDNDLLSQWRAYGGGGNGYNIGFGSVELSKAPGVQIRKVIYDSVVQNGYIKATVDSICELFDSVTGDKNIQGLDSTNTLPAFAAMLSQHLKEFLFTFKHSAFAEENEWRIIRPYTTHVDLKRLKFRQYNSVPVPYMELNYKDISPKMPILPIVQVTHGPVLNPQLTKKSLSLIMRQNGYDHAEINGSSTPLRL